MASKEVDRATCSAPQVGRDFKREIADLVTRADAAVQAAHGIDLDVETSQMLDRISIAADKAMQQVRECTNIQYPSACASLTLGLLTSSMRAIVPPQSAVAANGARTKIAEQQERFKAGLIASGNSLDDEEVEASAKRASNVRMIGTNKYADQMQYRRKQQEAQKLQASSNS